MHLSVHMTRDHSPANRPPMAHGSPPTLRLPCPFGMRTAPGAHRSRRAPRPCCHQGPIVRSAASAASAASTAAAPGGGKGCSASHLQMGHSGLRADSHWSMHSMWKRCLQGSTRCLSPSLRARGTRLLASLQPPGGACQAGPGPGAAGKRLCSSTHSPAGRPRRQTPKRRCRSAAGLHGRTGSPRGARRRAHR